MYYHVCGMAYIKDPLLLIRKSGSCSGGIGFPLSLYEWSFTIRQMPYNRKFNQCVHLVGIRERERETMLMTINRTETSGTKSSHSLQI